MKYFKLTTAFEPEIIGVKNGIYQVEWIESKYDEQEHAKIFSFFKSLDWNIINKQPDFTFTFHAKTEKRAILTDFLQFSPFFFGCPFLISKRVKEIFEKFNIQSYYLFPAIIYNKDKPLVDEYYLFYQPLQDYDIIDFSKSIFYQGNELIGKEYFHFNNQEEYKSVVGVKNVEKLVFNSVFDQSLDLFEGRIGGMYVSEALKDAIEILGFTGVHVLEQYEPELVIQ